MPDYRCKNCTNFHHHYTFDKRTIFRVYCGHCVVPKLKTRRPDAKICEHFEYSPPDESAFAQKEYLSKALLQYLLNLELPPEIKDAES